MFLICLNACYAFPKKRILKQRKNIKQQKIAAVFSCPSPLKKGWDEVIKKAALFRTALYRSQLKF
jgi:hypothetical protein